MSAPRLATIPFEHVEAEVAAFPLASEASFRLGLTSLNPAGSEMAGLWRYAEKEIMEALPSVHLEEAAAIRDRLWFQKTLDAYHLLEPVSLGTYLRHLAENYLDERGRPTEAPIPDSTSQNVTGAEARLRWCWMCRALPPDLLRTARGVVEGDDDPFPLHPSMSQILRDRGFAETHLHLGSALDFSLVWAALMSDLTGSESKHFDFKSLGACFEDGRDLATWLLQAAVVRLILAKWLFNRTRSGDSLSGLLIFAGGVWPEDRERSASGLATDLRNLLSRGDVMDFHHLATLLSEFVNGKLSNTQNFSFTAGETENMARRFQQVRGLYLSLLEPETLLRDRRTERSSLRAHRRPENRDDVFANDPLARIVGWLPTMGGSPETLFMRAALDHVAKANDDHDFARLLWQLTRIRCLLYRHLVERPLTPGLQWFMRFFSRIKPFRRRIPDRVRIQTAARLSGKDAGLCSLEVRLGTEESETSCLNAIRAVEDASSDWSNIDIGAVFHFSRKRGGGWEQGRLNAHGLDHSYPATADGVGTALRRGVRKISDDAGNPSGFRFARFYLQQRRHAQSLVNLFNMYPCLLRTIRGIDLCTDEAGVPVWVMAPLMRWVRSAGKLASIQLRRRGEPGLPPLRTSVHAGEDFVHLMSGLRRIDHTVIYLQLEEGDRLGHALALGADPSTWCSRIGRVIQTREERLLDLVWEWTCYAKHNVEVASTRLAYVRTEIVRLAQSIFESVYAARYGPEDLMTLLDSLHTEGELRRVGFPDQPALRTRKANWQPERNSNEEPESRAELLLIAYLCDERVWRRGRVPEVINFRSVRHEEEALGQLQNGLRGRIGALGLTIEVNPSSNLVIGDLGNLEAHPLWRLRPADSKEGLTPLSVCIGSDNPLTLATTLPHEYQLLFDALVLGGYSHEIAMNWIDEVRDAGMRTRFTLSRSTARISERLRPDILAASRPDSPP